MTALCEVLSYDISFLIACMNISLLLNKKVPVLVILIGLIVFPVGILIPWPFRFLYQSIVLIIVFYFNNKNLKKVISSVFFFYYIIFAVDTMYSVVITTLGITYTPITILISNLIISILSYVLIRRKLFLQLWNIIQNKLERYIYILVAVILVFIYINIGYRYDIINISVLIIFIFIFTYLVIKGLVQSHIMKTEAERILEYVETYEKQLDDFRISQHEYKNTLVCIRQMIPKNKKVTEYIDSILNTKNNEECTIINGLEKLKTSPIKGLIYYKLIQGRQKDIYTVLNVSSGIDFNKLNKIDINLLKDTTVILGILLDNAIEASLQASQKSLSLYMYQENNNIIFQISNTFKGSIDIDLLNNARYSTKGKNRGYGLALAKKTIKENNKLSMNSEISNDVFIQSLQVKLD